VSQIGTDAVPSPQVCTSTCAGREAEAAVLQFLAGRRWRTGGGAQGVTVTVPSSARFSLHFFDHFDSRWMLILMDPT